MRRVTQACVRFFEASLESWGRQPGGCLSRESERERAQPRGRAGDPSKQERVRSTCIDMWNLYIHIYLLQPVRVYKTEKGKTPYELSDE